MTGQALGIDHQNRGQNFDYDYFYEDAGIGKVLVQAGFISDPDKARSAELK